MNQKTRIMNIQIYYSVLVLLLFSFQSTFAQSWQSQAEGLLPNTYGVFGLSVVDENVVWAIAFDQTIGNNIPQDHIPKLLRTIDGGETWTCTEIEEAIGRISFDIVAFDANTAFITLQDYNNGNGRGVIKTIDGGETWVEKFSGVEGGVWIRFFNDLEGIIINRQAMATTTDGGESWQIVSPSNIPSFASDEFTIISSGTNSCQVLDDHIWFGTNKGRVFRSKDKGYTWQAFETSLGSNSTILSVAFRDTLNGVALDASSFLSKFASTSDGGVTWNNIFSIPGVAISNIEVVPNSNGVLVGASGLFSSTTLSVYSTDSGATWEVINTNIPFGGIDFADANIGWAARGIINNQSQAAMYKWEGDIFVSNAELETQKSSTVFPNPFEQELNISGSEVVQEIRLFSIDGQLIQAIEVNTETTRLDLQNLNPGAYILELIFKDNFSIRKKVIKAN